MVTGSAPSALLVFPSIQSIFSHYRLFRWIQVNYTAQNPRLGLTCNLVGGSQILTIGGSDPNAPGVNTSHTGTSGFLKPISTTPDPNLQSLAVFDMTQLAWASQYTSGQPAYYEQSEAIKGVYVDPQL